MAKDNANPTILSVSELPSHRAKRNRGQAPKRKTIGDILAAPPSYAMDPFYMSEFSDDSDDSGVEPIDEQEIYGKSIRVDIQAYSSSNCPRPCSGAP